MTKKEITPVILDQIGFTIVEIMIAITIFAIGILAINVMQTTSIKGNSSANLVTGRTNWAASQVEQIVGWNYTNTNLTDDGNASSIDGTITSPDNVYTIIWRVADNTPIKNTKTITITVSDSILAKSTIIAFLKAKVL